MSKFLKRAAAALAIAAAGVWAFNASLFAPRFSGDGPRIIAHRGVHQDFDRAGLTNETCTAARLIPTDHGLMENTLPSMEAAFDLGADVVEIDIHLTSDGRLAVFHDWTLDCRTDGSGNTEDATLAELQALDIGYGYTADGATFPLRGRGVGLMPSFDQVMQAFPDGRFLIDIKSGDPAVGEALVAVLEAHPDWRARVWGVYGGPRPVAAYQAAFPEARTFTAPRVKACLKGYVATGWFGRVPAACENTAVYVPVNYARLMWGWPNRFVARLEAAGSTVVLIGPHERGSVGTRGLDTAELFDRVPNAFAGYVQTDRIDVIGPQARAN